MSRDSIIVDAEEVCLMNRPKEKRIMFSFVLLFPLWLLSFPVPGADNEYVFEEFSAGAATDALPEKWNTESGKWIIRPLSKPVSDPQVTPAVQSSYHVAFPGVCKTKSGQLIAVYREAFHHASGEPEDGHIMLVRSSDKGETWSKPELAYDDPEYDDRNAAISCMNDGTLCLIWDKYLHGKHHWAWLSTSKDEGHTWSEAVIITRLENVHTRSRGIDLGGDIWLFPWADADHGPRTATYFTRYNSETGEFEQIQATQTGKRNWADEVCVTETQEGTLVALIRSQSDPALWQIESRDDGRTWSTPHLTEIPSQFTPADLITLTNGWLVAAFSFRERRNERLCVSRDNGRTWDVENSVNVYDATLGYGDRSYPASVQIDEKTIGTVLYETKDHPTGGTIYFVRTPISSLDGSKVNTLYQGDRESDPALIFWPKEPGMDSVEFEYRFTGLFGDPPNCIGVVMASENTSEMAAFQYQMGTAPDRRSIPVNHVKFVRGIGKEEQTIQEGSAKGDSFNDGCVHVMAVQREGEEWVFSIDGEEQLTCEAESWTPAGILTRRATVAIYRVGRE